MAGDYWRSTQAHHWLLSPFDLQVSRLEDIRYAGTDEKLSGATIWLCNSIAHLCKRLSLRQRVTATATIFFHRFYAIPPNAYCNTDPCLVATACVYVAAKVEETPLHVKVVMMEAGKLWKECGHSGFPSSSSDLAEMEFYLLRDLNYQLILYHPYRSLMAIAGSVGHTAIEKSAAGKKLEAKVASMVARAGHSQGQSQTQAQSASSGLGLDAQALGVGSSQLGGPSQDMISSSSAAAATTTPTTVGTATATATATATQQQDMTAVRYQLEEELARAAMTMGDHDQPIARAAEIDEGVVQMAWFLLNDTYRHATLHLLYPPYILALSAIYLALVLRETTREKMLASAHRMQERRRMKAEYDERERQQQRHHRSDGPADTSHPPAAAASSSSSSMAKSAPTSKANPATAAAASATQQSPAPPHPPSHAPTPQPDILTFLASLNIAPTTQLASCIQAILDGYSMWNRVHTDIEGASGSLKVMRWLEEWRRSREEELRVIELRGG